MSNNHPTSFKATSKTKKGKDGLLKSTRVPSKATIEGTDLSVGLVVKVFDPPTNTIPTWSGQIDKVDGNKYKATLNYDTSRNQFPRDGDETVRVTVGDGTVPVNPTVNVGDPPLLVDGQYTVACDDTTGNLTALAPNNNNDGVELINGNAPKWIYSVVVDPRGDCYTICYVDSNNGEHYLNWANDGNGGTNVSLVAHTGDGTTWQIDQQQKNIIAVKTTGPDEPASKYLNGDSVNGVVDMLNMTNPNGGTSWTTNAAFFHGDA